MSIYDTRAWLRIKDFWSEPDYISSCAYGLPFRMVRNGTKAWCGYVGIPSHHPHFGKDWDDMVSVDTNLVRLGQQSPLAIFSAALGVIRLPEEDQERLCPISILYDCPGGITWARDHYPYSSRDGYWWFGFDCNHYDHYSPKDAFDEVFSREEWRPGTYMNAVRVEYECRRLASQLSDFTSNFREHF